jgi:tRNA 2-thiouridine synthesizing protein E
MSHLLQLPGGNRVRLDEYGHLSRREDWSREVAVAMAAVDGLELGAGHWLVMDIMAAHYQAFGVETPMRLLVRKLRERGAPDLASSRALYRMFPEGPVRQGSRYAGLPIPVSCI